MSLLLVDVDVVVIVVVVVVFYTQSTIRNAIECTIVTELSSSIATASNDDDDYLT